MKTSLLAILLLFSMSFAARSADPAAGETVLFDGKSLDAWEFAPGAWEIEEDGSLVCRMESSEGDDGTEKTRSMGYIWTKSDFGDFELSLSYKISEGANSGVFYRAEKKDPVHRGFEVQLMDDAGYQKTHGSLDAKKLNGSFYEGKAPAADAAKPVGEWNTFVLRCEGSRQTCHLNGVLVFDVDVNDWPEAGKNPDGTPQQVQGGDQGQTPQRPHRPAESRAGRLVQGDQGQVAEVTLFSSTFPASREGSSLPAKTRRGRIRRCWRCSRHR